ncbi:MAG: hypothetical protein ACLGIY_02590, partial [Betaproteobacteria bacterium]
LFNWWRQIQRNELIPGRWQQEVCLLAHPAMNDVGVDSVCKRYAAEMPEPAGQDGIHNGMVCT